MVRPVSHDVLLSQLPIVPVAPVRPIIWHYPYGTTCVICHELWPCRARCEWVADHA